MSNSEMLVAPASSESKVTVRCGMCGIAVRRADAFIALDGTAKCTRCEWKDMNRKAAEAAFAKGANGAGPFAPEAAGIRKGVAGGVTMIAIAAVWFFVGLSAGYVFYYPPILFLIGVYALLKGLATGNFGG